MPEHTTISEQAQVNSSAVKDALPVQECVKENIYTENLSRFPIQRKLSIGAIDDPLEDEADAMADKVMRMPETSFIQRKCAHCEEEEKVQSKPLANLIQRKCHHCEEEEKLQRKSVVPFIQKKESSNISIAGDSVLNQIQSTKGNGTSLPETTKSFMESRFGANFSNVNIHTGNYASQLSSQLNAQAFTVGNDIYFNEGRYQPDSDAGRHLLAHELTHTIQQGASGSKNSVQPKLDFIQRKEDIKPISEAKEGTFGDRKIKVERVITPGECKVTKNSSSSATGGFKNDKVFFEAKGCKNNVTGEAYGDLDFKDFVDGANTFIKKVPSLISGGNISDNLSKEIDQDFKDANLKASLRLVLRIGHVRVEAAGTGSANLDNASQAGVTGFIRYANGKFNIELGGGFDKTWSQLKDTEEIKVHLYTDIGPLIIRVDAKHTGAGTTIEGKIGDTDISKSHAIGVTYSDENGEKKVIFNFSFTLPEKLPTENAPDCVFCDCEKPDIKFTCWDVTPDKPGDTPKKPEKKYIPLFYQYATTNPRNDAEVPASEYDKTIYSIIRAIEDGYTISRIEGYTSPEGTLDKHGKFEGNKLLSTHRAQTAEQRIKELIAKRLEVINPSIWKDSDKLKARLTEASNKSISIEGMKEMYGADATSPDITEKKLFGHLSDELITPGADQPDKLETDRVKGETLPEELRGLAEKDISSFRTGVENDKRLTQGQRLQKLYPWLRRALVIMDPPAPVFDTDIAKLSPGILKQIVGVPAVACTPEHLKLFEETPLTPNEKLIIDHCSSKKTK